MGPLRSRTPAWFRHRHSPHDIPPPPPRKLSGWDWAGRMGALWGVPGRGQGGAKPAPPTPFPGLHLQDHPSLENPDTGAAAFLPSPLPGLKPAPRKWGLAMSPPNLRFTSRQPLLRKLAFQLAGQSVQPSSAGSHWPAVKERRSLCCSGR